MNYVTSESSKLCSALKTVTHKEQQIENVKTCDKQNANQSKYTIILNTGIKLIFWLIFLSDFICRK